MHPNRTPTPQKRSCRYFPTSVPVPAILNKELKGIRAWVSIIDEGLIVIIENYG
jgi:hypothetical protein